MCNNGGIEIKEPLEIYKKRERYYNNLTKKQNNTINIFSSMRLIVALAGALNILLLYITERQCFVYYILFVYILIFIYLVLNHNKVKHNYKYACKIHKINENAVERINGNWNKFKDTGSEFQDDNHSFSKDLDVFGQGSLFQYINTTTTHMGRLALKKHLTEPCKNKEGIEKRQESINELGVKLPWRQKLMAEGLMTVDKPNNNEDLYRFFELEDELYTKPWLTIGAIIIPVITTGTTILHLFKIIPFKVPFLLIGIQCLLLKFKNKERSKVLNLVYKYKQSIKVYSKMLYQIEDVDFKSKYLLELKDKLIDGNKRTACHQIKEFENIADSIANISRDNPNWVRPKIIDKPYYIMAKALGHPLITDNRIYNDFEIDGLTKALLITGSNMSGKSTYLRSVGINLVLAYAGAPVCSRQFYCNIFSIYTCMRVSDNLEKNTSSFYAELLRIKEIVDASKNENVFFLLDEVFKGTNSQDRHEGAKILVNQLVANNSIGLVSTHDLELEVLEKESNKKIKNYHFKEYYKDNKILFDYKLKPGISTTRNAMYLIKMMGIEG